MNNPAVIVNDPAPPAIEPVKGDFVYVKAALVTDVYWHRAPFDVFAQLPSGLQLHCLRSDVLRVLPRDFAKGDRIVHRGTDGYGTVLAVDGHDQALWVRYDAGRLATVPMTDVKHGAHLGPQPL